MAKYICVCMVCMNTICIDDQMDSPIRLPKLASFSAHGFILKFWVTIVGRCEGRDDTGRCLYIKLRTCVCTWWFCQQRNRLSYHQKFDGPFAARFHFEKIFGEPVSCGMKVIFLVDKQDNG